MTALRTIALAIGIAVLLSVLATLFLPPLPWRNDDGPGFKLRRDCASLVDSVMNEDRTVSRAELRAELKQQGVDVPALPSRDLDSPIGPKTWLTKVGDRDAARKAYEAWWEEIRSRPTYQPAWEAAFSKKREKAIKECIVNRAAREGVTIP